MKKILNVKTKIQYKQKVQQFVSVGQSLSSVKNVMEFGIKRLLEVSSSLSGSEALSRLLKLKLTVQSLRLSPLPRNLAEKTSIGIKRLVHQLLHVAVEEEKPFDWWTTMGSKM